MTNASAYAVVETTPDDVASIHATLYAADPPDVPPRDYATLAFALRAPDGTLVGGLVGATMWGWLTVDALWVDASLRGRGLGAQLLDAAERAARGRGCTHARLDTFDFQARAFYERCGYEVYGRLDGFPPGHAQLHLGKRLAVSTADGG